MSKGGNPMWIRKNERFVYPEKWTWKDGRQWIKNIQYRIVRWHGQDGEVKWKIDHLLTFLQGYCREVNWFSYFKDGDERIAKLNFYILDGLDAEQRKTVCPYWLLIHQPKSDRLQLDPILIWTKDFQMESSELKPLILTNDRSLRQRPCKYEINRKWKRSSLYKSIEQNGSLSDSSIRLYQCCIDSYLLFIL